MIVSKELLGFDRVTIAAGQTRTVSMTLPASELAYWDTGQNNFYCEPGSFDVMEGNSSADIRLTTSLYVTDGSATPAPTSIPTQSQGNTGDVDTDGDIDIIDGLLVAQ